jgi:hypothetical protein
LQRLFLEIHDKPMHEQRSLLEHRFAEWRGGLDQIDDVLVMGFKMPSA